MKSRWISEKDKTGSLGIKTTPQKKPSPTCGEGGIIGFWIENKKDKDAQSSKRRANRERRPATH